MFSNPYPFSTGELAPWFFCLGAGHGATGALGELGGRGFGRTAAPVGGRQEPPSWRRGAAPARAVLPSCLPEAL